MDRKRPARLAVSLRFGALIGIWLVECLVAVAAGAFDDQLVTPGYRIDLPRDEGSHPQFRTEWWYVTGWVEDAAGEACGFQVAFFRTRPGIHEDNPSQFAPRQLLFAHAAISDPRRGRLSSAQRAARAGFGLARAEQGVLDVAIDDWYLRRAGQDRLRARVAGGDLVLEADFRQRVPPLLHGESGFSRKGPRPSSASHYYSLPQLEVQGHLTLAGRVREVRGLAWMDHEWFGEIMDEHSQGWDWVGLNLHGGGALMAFRMRDVAGGVHWAAGTLRTGPTDAPRAFTPEQIEWTPLRRWRSPRTGVEYPIEWRVRVGERTVILRPLMDDQEQDARGSTGTLYWEGAVRALDAAGHEVGRGYLEMTGYSEKVRL